MTSIPIALHAPNTQLPIRPVRLSDADSLHANCWPSRSFMNVYNLVSRALRYSAEGRGQGLVVAGTDQVIQGYGQFAIWPTCAEISDMVVAEPWRGRGIGTILIQTLARAAVQLGAEEIEIGAALNNPRAAALYRRLGFEDSHTVMLNLDRGKEHVLFLRLSLQEKSISLELD